MSQKSPNSQLEGENKISLLKIINNHECVEDTLDELQDFLVNNSFQNIANENIFDIALTYARQKVYEIIKAINEDIENIDFDDDRNPCNTLAKLLKCWDITLNRLTLAEIRVTDVKCFIESYFEVTITTLSFCKTWAKDNQDASDMLTSSLTSIFRQCIDTLNLFYNHLDSADSNISFDTNEEAEMEILLNILDNTGKLATMLTDTDLRTLMDMWKRFGKLIMKYCSETKNSSLDRIIFHFKGLAESVVNVLTYINKKQSTSNERPIFCCRILIIILGKISDAFCDHIQSDAMNEFINMIMHAYMYTEQILEIEDSNAEFIKFIRSNFEFVIEPFIDVIFQSDSFKAALFNYAASGNKNFITYHLLILSVVKKVSTLPYENQREWYNKEQCIIDVCFQNIDKLTADICMDKLRIQVSENVAYGSYKTSIYEATFLSICTLICQMKNSDLDQLTMLLLRQLLSGNFFSSLLSSDIWCFICRLGSSEMCYNHFKYLIEIYGMLKERKNNLNVVVLYNLIGRQYDLLLDTDGVDFISSIKKTSDPHCWSPVARVMDVEEKKQLQRKFDVFTMHDRIEADLRNLEEQPSLNSLDALMKDLAIIESTDVPQDERLCDTFIKMWNKFVYILSDCDGRVLLLLEDFASSLLRAIRPHQKQDKYMTSILESMIMMYPYASSGLRLEFCRFFVRCIPNFSDCHKSLAADIMYRVMSDDDSSVQQQSFVMFDQLTLKCQSMDVLSSVALAVKNGRADLYKHLSEYIAGNVPENLNLDDFFTNLCAYWEESRKHVCQKISRMNCEKMPKLSQPAVSEWHNSDNRQSSQFENIERQANKVCTDMELILRLKGYLKKETSDRLRQLCLKFLD